MKILMFFGVPEHFCNVKNTFTVLKLETRDEINPCDRQLQKSFSSECDVYKSMRRFAVSKYSDITVVKEA